MTIALDVTGFKITERGNRFPNKWKRKRKAWIKMHIAMDAEMINVVFVSITDKHTPDTKEFKEMIDPVAEKDKEVYGDGGYDSRKGFEYLSKKGVEVVILTRSSLRSLSRGCSPARGRVVRRIRKIGPEECKREVDYGKRWRVKIFFSALKRTVGEEIMANRLLYQIQEEIMKIYAHFLIIKNTVVSWLSPLTTKHARYLLIRKEMRFAI